jgi:DNA-binding LacI/PurR family transcriptional regulator
MRIPDDISVVGFNESEATLLEPQLTSVREFPEELGRHLAEFVQRRIESSDREPQHLTIPTRVVIRKSTAPLNGRPLGAAKTLSVKVVGSSKETRQMS